MHYLSYMVKLQFCLKVIKFVVTVVRYLQLIKTNACDFIYRFVNKHLLFHNLDFDIDLSVNEEDEEKRKSRQCIVITCMICTLLFDYMSVNAIYRRSVLPVSGSVIKFHPHHTRGRRAFPSLMAEGI